jgi:hypothetical protein
MANCRLWKKLRFEFASNSIAMNQGQLPNNWLYLREKTMKWKKS